MNSFKGVAVMSCTLLAAAVVSADELVTYPPPEGIPASDQYAVSVTQNGVRRDSFAYKVCAQQPETNREKTTSWTTFSFSGKVEVSVRKLRGSFSSCRVLPSSRRIKPSVRGDTATFELRAPGQYAVEFDGNIAHPLLIFANPLERDVPKKSDPNVVYFGPGVHDPGELTIRSGQTIYLAGGACVRERIVGENVVNASIQGRGVLSGELFPKGGDPMIHIRGWRSRHVRIEGITLVQSPQYNISLAGVGHAVRNVKMISWYFSTDGVGLGLYGLVEDCFFKVNDDAVKLYWTAMIVRRCVFWQLENGAVFQISWNMPTDHSNFHVYDCDVIRTEHHWRNDNCAIFCSIHGGSGHMSNYLFENIRIENSHWRLMNLVMKKTRWSAKSKSFGRISNLRFRNVSAQGKFKLPSTIRGADPAHRICNVLLENLNIGGRLIRNAEEGNFEIDPNTTANICFLVTEPK